MKMNEEEVLDANDAISSCFQRLHKAKRILLKMKRKLMKNKYRNKKKQQKKSREIEIESIFNIRRGTEIKRNPINRKIILRKNE
jgi:hypothetical protein